MGTTLTPINGFVLPDDNEPLAAVYTWMRQHAAEMEAALRAHGLTSSDVTGYLDLLGRVNTLEAGAGVATLQAMTLGANWSNVAGYANWSVLKRPGMAHLTSMTNSTAAIGATAVIGTLPAGIRVLGVTGSNVLPLMVPGDVLPGKGFVRVDINAAGQLLAVNAIASGSYLFWDTVKFPTTTA